jgi:hypothetical protein
MLWRGYLREGAADPCGRHDCHQFGANAIDAYRHGDPREIFRDER